MSWPRVALGRRARTSYEGVMNKHEFIGRNGEARLRYLDSDFQVIVPGAYVTCSVTGRRIMLSDLRYWSVDRQEAYADAEASLKRELSLRRSV
jgi:hypothetical protein